MPNNDLTRLMNFNDGEGLTHDDLNDMAQLLLNKVLSQHIQGGGYLARAQSSQLAGNNAEGGDPHFSGLQLSNLQTNALYSPYITSGIVRPLSGGTGAPVINNGFSEMVLENGLLVQRRTGSTPGTVPGGAPFELAFNIEDEERILSDDVNANAAPGAGNPRWDTWGVRIGYGTDTDNESRDFKDGITGALSTQSLPKRRRLTFESEFVLGPQSATFDMATLSAGFVPLMTLRRPVGENPNAVDPDDVYYHVYPMRLGMEDVLGEDMIYGGVTGAWTRDTLSTGALVKVGAAAGDVIAVPRTMDGSKRLVAVGVMASLPGNDFDVQAGRWRYDEGVGVPVFTELVDLAATGVGNITGTEGFQVDGEAQWSPTTAKRLPIWGNGTHRGPLYNNMRRGGVSSGQNAGLDKLAVRLVSDGNWANNAKISLIRFYYLY